MRKSLKYNLYMILLLVILIFKGIPSFAQNIDSLKLELNNAKNDTTKLSVLLELVENISDDNVWPIYNKQMLELSEKLIKNNNELIQKKGKKCLADAYNNIGFMYNNQGDIPNALDYFGKSLKLQEELGYKQGIAELLSNIGVIYYLQNELEKALDFYLKSLKLREEIGDKNAIANSLSNIGNLFYTQKNMSRALYYSDRSLKLQEEIGDKEGMAYSLNNLGTIYFYKNNIEDALGVYYRSKQIREEIGDEQGVAASQHNIATAYLKLAAQKGSKTINKKHLAMALSNADSSLLISKKLGFPANIRNAERLLSRIDSLRGNFSEAFEHYKQYIFYRDSITNEGTRKASIKNQLKYEFDKKEAVINEQQEKERAVAKEKDRFQQIIIISVIVGLLVVMLFAAFIFRTLKVTRHQKLIIEEKQKEILDSIHYAKRIQTSLLPTEKYIEKSLAQLNK
ncbi:MAG: tetratricopeptide repeat protein [Bacteroidota bacterium]|nr:tetratricopeptide repeat protein [Bacteroidota bacterium]MDP3145969.1 tetratricopeptide repeat protein [Bacteroidota bacterium]MDP3558604.1 tetratricopeptide repeat protein [Bacteroidota bacterium]